MNLPNVFFIYKKIWTNQKQKQKNEKRIAEKTQTWKNAKGNLSTQIKYVLTYQDLNLLNYGSDKCHSNKM